MYKCHNFAGSHDKAVSCVKVSPLHPHLIVSSSADKTTKIWDISRDLESDDVDGNENCGGDSGFNGCNDDDNDKSSKESFSSTTTTAAASVTATTPSAAATDSTTTSSPTSADASPPLDEKEREKSKSRKLKMLKPSLTLRGHTEGINDVEFTEDSRFVATASDDKTIRIWDVEHKSEDALVELRGHSSFVFTLKFNHSSNLIVSGSFDEHIKLWDPRTATCISTIPAHSEPITAVSFNRDSTCVAVSLISLFFFIFFYFFFTSSIEMFSCDFNLLDFR